MITGGSIYRCTLRIVKDEFYGHPITCLFEKISHKICFNRVNVSVGEKEERNMMTGMHTVVDIFCVGCGSIVGWKYVRFIGSNLNFQCIYVSIVAVSYADYFPPGDCP